MEKKSLTPTPHISAAEGDFAKTVLMPGDPLRAKFIAETFLEDARLVNEVRGALGYTGTYKGKPVSVMSSGMGMPSMGIYSHELFNFYGVENIIRIGSAGALSDKLDLYDIVAAQAACTNSAYASQYGLCGSYAPIADYGLLRLFDETCEKLGQKVFIGNVISSDTFYSADSTAAAKWRDMGVLAIEMETAALYMNAAAAGKKALAVFTISDCLFTNKETTSQERQTSFTAMMKAALETANALI